MLPTLESEGERYSLFLKRLNRLEASMSVTRKVLRFGKPLPLVKNIIQRLTRLQSQPIVFWRCVSEMI
jgi:hypothetical protein